MEGDVWTGSVVLRGDSPGGCFHKMVRRVATDFLTDEADRRYYADRYTCCPPPLFVPLITLLEVSGHGGDGDDSDNDGCDTNNHNDEGDNDDDSSSSNSSSNDYDDDDDSNIEIEMMIKKKCR